MYIGRPEYDVKLLQETRTIRVLLSKNRYAPAPDNGGRIEITEHTTQHTCPTYGW